MTCPRQITRLLCAVLAGAAFVASTDASEDTPTRDRSHEELFTGRRFPSAEQCRTCHPDHYREWSGSQHAYAQLSPVFNAMQGRVLQLTNGTNGEFCIRCHTPIGMTLEEPIFTANASRAPISREGVTCVVCHRVNHAFGKVSGRASLAEGDLFAPVRGPTENSELMRVLGDRSRFKVVTEPGSQGRPIHNDIEPFFAMTQPGFCGSCHDVSLVNGFRLEEAFSEYKASPAARRGVTCQDCHMGAEPGVPAGYRQAPAARVGDLLTRVRQRSDHRFPGPDHSVIHPGIFPHNPDAAKLATTDQWLQFDDQAGWGTDAFEATVDDDLAFPERWRDPEDRYEAREVLDRQHAHLAEMARARLAILRAGYGLGAIVVERFDDRNLRFRIELKSLTDGHNVPTGFTAERIVFLRVTVTDASGATIYRSGDLDSYGDLRDGHSLDVRAGRAALDHDLLSLQSKFLVRTIHGGEREQVLAVNQSLDALPFVRPETRSTILLGRPLDARIHKLGIEPGGARTGRYRVPRRQLTGNVPYRIDVELVAGMIPVNLLHEIARVGFDYGLDTETIARRVLAGHVVLAETSHRVGVNPTSSSETVTTTSQRSSP